MHVVLHVLVHQNDLLSEALEVTNLLFALVLNAFNLLLEGLRLLVLLVHRLLHSDQVLCHLEGLGIKVCLQLFKQHLLGFHEGEQLGALAAELGLDLALQLVDEGLHLRVGDICLFLGARLRALDELRDLLIELLPFDIVIDLNLLRVLFQFLFFLIEHMKQLALDRSAFGHAQALFREVLDIQDLLVYFFLVSLQLGRLVLQVVDPRLYGHQRVNDLLLQVLVQLNRVHLLELVDSLLHGNSLVIQRLQLPTSVPLHVKEQPLQLLDVLGLVNHS